MPKIYEWTYKGDKGQITADNLKDAKKSIAKKFGNAIKIPKGTTIKKVGLCKKKNAVGSIATESKPKPKNVIKEDLPDGTVLKGPGGKTYTVGQRGKKPFWFQEAVMKYQGISCVKLERSPVTPQETHTVSDPDGSVYNGYELKNCMVLKKESSITGSVSIVYDIDGVRRGCYVSEDAEIILPAKTKIWKLYGELSIS
jgi:hypothetical protein